MTYRQFIKKLLRVALDKKLADSQINLQQIKAILAGREDKIKPRDFWRELAKP